MGRYEPLALDARTGRARDDVSHIMAELGAAIRQHGDNLEALDLARPQENARRIDGFMAQNQLQRRDSFAAGNGLALSRQLEHRYGEVLREKYPVPTGLTLFPIDTSVPPGARHHTVTRFYDAGDAAVYRAGMEIPMVGVNAAEELFPVRHYVNSFGWDLFQALSAQYINFSQAAEYLRVARDIMMRFANRKTWYGSDVHGIYGVLNYPWLYKMVSMLSWDSSAAAQDLLDELNFGANFAEENSDEVFTPNKMVTTAKVRNLLNRVYIGDDKKRTVRQAFLEDNEKIDSIETAPELSGVGPGNTDGILFYRDDRMGISNVLPQTFTTLPQQLKGFESITYAYMSHGGVIMRDVGNNLLMWVDVSEA